MHCIQHFKKSLAAALFFATIVPLCARDVEIVVEDTDLGLPLEGAVIRSWDGKQYACDENGRALVSVPDERSVVVQAAYPGYENGRLVVGAGKNSFTVGLRLSGIMESRELVIEAARPGVSETKTGRSVAVSEREIAQTGEIGIIEDVMTTIKLLPGVGYAGFFNAQPSIRGGDPGDMTAALDGFYINNPYHWGGGFSIFDPRMVQNAQLSHGVFSTRYGHTISGLLEITSKEPSPTETEFELGVNISAANFNLSVPLFGKGGVLFMGRVTYYDLIIAAAKEYATVNPEYEVINSIRQAPYIRSGIITGNYRFLHNLELNASGFWGMDGIGVRYDNDPQTTDSLTSRSLLDFDYTNYQGFITAGLSWNPRNDMLLKLTAGTGYEQADINGDIETDILGKQYSKEFQDKYNSGNTLPITYDFNTAMHIKQSDISVNAQGRLDWDWELGKGFLAAAGVQELFSRYTSSGDQNMLSELRLSSLPADQQAVLRGLITSLGLNPTDEANLLRELRVSFPITYSPDAGNKLFTTSAYALTEYTSPDSRLNAELGLRMDHFFLLGDGFSLQSNPALNPRLNVDFNVFKNQWILRSLDISAGTGLFSSVNDIAMIAEERYHITDFRPNRSWTSVLGTRMEFSEGVSFNVEGYYKYVFDRTYIPIAYTLDAIDVQPQFNGEGRVWGIDVMAQKMQSRYWDGWISYSFSWAKYRDPNAVGANAGISGGNRGSDWYFPSYHRYHNLNLVLNIKPVPWINIYTRFGFASGVQFSRRIGDGPVSYPVLVYDSDPAKWKFIEKYYWPSVPDENNRTTPSLPLDFKVSFLGNSKNGKVNYETYIAFENVLALLYTAQGNTSFNSYTGQEDTGSTSASYEIPIPIPSIGFRISY